jgi:hypothetical protein
MTSLAFVLMLQLGASQFLVSTKAGLVNFVQGDASVKPKQSLQEGEPIKTGNGSAAEILLNPGSYLRVGANSEVVLDKIELISVAVHVVSGSAIIEASGFTEGTPLRVRTEDLEALIIDDGIYRFANGKATVVSGKLQVAGRNFTYKKGWQVSAITAAKLGKSLPGDLDVWSQRRSELLATANTSMANTLRRTSPSLASSFYDVWLWAPSLGAFTFMPGYRYQSPYGYSYRTVNEIYNRGNSGGGNGGNAGNSGGFSNAGNTSNTGNSNSSGGGSSAASAPPPAPRQIDLSQVPSAVRMKLDPPER